MTKFYTGIGSRKTPEDILEVMRLLGSSLSRMGFALRSGGAPGADTFFEKGAGLEGSKEIYLPWKNFNKNPSTLYEITDEAMELAADVYGSRFKYLKRPVKLLMARNVYQVLGMNLFIPSEFVLCWTPDGCESEKTRGPKTGGTGQAIALASRNDVLVFNLKNEGRFDDFIEYVGRRS